MMTIQLINPVTGASLQPTDAGLIDTAGVSFPQRKGAYRFVEDENYTDSFGFQWNKFAKTQIDRFQRSISQSKERFFAATGWDQEDLTGQNVLEVGSGAGRFSQIVLDHTNANLYSVDYSNAVEANYRNNGPHERLRLYQASIYALPFAPQQFDKVFCFGVLQHTPDFRKSVECLAQMVKPGGELVIDFYPIRGWYTKIHAKYLLRPATRKMAHDKLLRWIDTNADRLIKVYRFFDRLGLGKVVNRFVPICDIKHTLPHDLSERELREWVVLDTFDMFSPAYDQPQRLNTVVKWVKASGLQTVQGSVVPYGDGNSVTLVKGVA